MKIRGLSDALTCIMFAYGCENLRDVYRETLKFKADNAEELVFKYKKPETETSISESDIKESFKFLKETGYKSREVTKFIKSFAPPSSGTIAPGYLPEHEYTDEVPEKLKRELADDKNYD